MASLSGDLVVAFWTDSALGLILIAVIGAAVVAVSGWGIRRWAWPAWRRWRRNWQLRKRAPDEVEELLSYLAHVRDFVMPMILRARQDPTSVRTEIRQYVLEPIRGYVPTDPGEHLKVVWFRPNAARTELRMYEQVGHTPEGQATAALPIGSGAAGKAFTTGKTVYEPDIEASSVFHPLPKGTKRGSIVCAHQARGRVNWGPERPLRRPWGIRTAPGAVLSGTRFRDRRNRDRRGRVALAVLSCTEEETAEMSHVPSVSSVPYRELERGNITPDEYAQEVRREVRELVRESDSSSRAGNEASTTERQGHRK